MGPLPSSPAPCCPTCAADAAYGSLLANTADAITVLEADGTIRYQTPSIEDVLGHPPEELAGTSLLDVVHPDERAWVSAQFALVVARSGQAEGSLVVRWRHRDGGYRSVERRSANLLADPAVSAIVISSRDVTERVSLQEKLTRGAFHDGLTGLANRALFVDRLEHALYTGNPQEERLAVLFIDLDDFKKINDSLGHSAGDELLRICARRLTERLAAGDTAARLGGDEFAVLLEGCSTPEAAAQMARYLLDALAEPVELHGRRVVVPGSAGIALVNPNPALAGEVELALRDHGLPPDLLMLELTESAVMRDVVAAAHRLDAIARLGVRIGVDDFGEGHSSLAYLSSLPLDMLKIPRTFVDQLRTPGANLGLVRAIVELARSFGLRTVAEGIEERGQLEPLLGLGCDLAQGFLFARPTGAAEMAALAGRTLPAGLPGARPASPRCA